MKKLRYIEWSLIATLAIGSTTLFTKTVNAQCWRDPSLCDPSRVIKPPVPLPGVNDIKRELDNCFNGGGCSLPADELWGEAGRVAFLNAKEAIAAKNLSLPSKSLDDWQKRYLRQYYGNLVDQVKIKYGATTLDNWRYRNVVISAPSDGQTFCNEIYITRRYSPNNYSLLKLIAHEMKHSEQCERLGGASNFGYTYFKEYNRANQNYRNNKLEREAYDYVASIDLRSEPTAGRAIPDKYNLGDRIVSHREMPEGYYLLSGDKRWKMVIQGDGNLVIYGPQGPIWGSGTDGKGKYPFKLAMQSDGNLVIYGANGPTWASNTNGMGTGPYTLVMQNDANLVLYDQNGPIWATNTCCR